MAIMFLGGSCMSKLVNERNHIMMMMCYKDEKLVAGVTESLD